MTDKQPEALVWAGQLELLLPFMSPATFIAANKAIAELRRLHEENEALRARLAQREREWQGLTDEEITETLKRFGLGERAALARAIEAKLKEKNAPASPS